jgi:hypothetical protein
VPQQYQELIVKFSKNMATNYAISNNTKLEADPWIAAFGEDHRRSRTVKLHSIFCKNVQSVGRSGSVPSNALVVNVREIYQYLQERNRTENAMAFDPEFTAALTELNAELTRFFSKKETNRYEKQ